MSRDDEVPRPRNSKNTKRWCRGKPGREHTPECRDYQDVKRWMQGRWPGMFKGWRILVCTSCGRELAWYVPPSRPDVKHKKPEWVTA